MTLGGPRFARIGLAVAAFAFTACGEQLPTAESEVAAELRALRSVLVQQSQQAQVPPAIAADPQRDVTAIMAPLRDVLAALAQRTGDLEQRQLALTQELQRWSKLLVETASTERRTEGEAITQRLQTLENALAAQEARHREVEKILQDALDRTTEQLDAFLRRLVPRTPPAAGQPAPGTGSAAPQPAEPTNTTSPTGLPAGMPLETPRSAQAGRSGSSRWWPWVALLGTTLGIGGFLWIRRPTRDRGFADRQGDRLAAEAAGGFDPGVQDIWAAAALLGEAVGRLRQQQAEPGEPVPAITATESPVADTVADQLPDDEFFVIEDDLAEIPAAPPTPPTVRTANTNLPRTLPTLHLHLPVHDGTPSEAAVARMLAEDPRVLRAPAPTLRGSRDAIAIRCHVLPDLPQGELAHLEQRLRAAGR